MKLRVTIDTDNIDFTSFNSLESGVFGVDKDGVYHAWYGSRTYIVPFERQLIKSCKHEFNDGDSPYTKEGECFDCKSKRDSYNAKFLEEIDVE